MFTVNCRPERVEYYHGTSTLSGIKDRLLPPKYSGVISEKGRKKNLNKIFFTKDKGLAEIYAGRACNSYGGKPKIYRVVNPVNVKCMNDSPGASVYHADWSFCEEI